MHIQSFCHAARAASFQKMLGLAAIVSLSLVTVLPASADDKPDLSKVKLAVGIQGGSIGNSVVTLEAAGLFKDVPYQIEWANFSGANAAVEALQAGAIDVDIDLNLSTPVINQANAARPWTKEDRPYVIIGANKHLKRAGTAILVNPKSGIKSVSDLEGKSVSFAKGTANHYFFALAAKKAGLDLSKVNVVALSLAESRAAFVGGSVDAFITNVYNARPLISKGEAEIIETSKGLYESYAWLVARTDALADAGKEAAIADLLVRLQKSAVWQAENRDEVAKIYQEVGRQSAEDAKQNASETDTAYVPITDDVIAVNRQQAEVFFEAEVTKTRIDPGIGFDDRFNSLIAANPGLSGKAVD